MPPRPRHTATQDKQNRELRTGLQFGNPDPMPSASDIVHRYGPREFGSPYRSTVPLLSLLLHDRSTFEKMLGEIGVGGLAPMFLEYAVPPVRGRGKASHTDLMILNRPGCVAIEAKWTEPPYQTAGKWLAARGTENAKNVLSGWLGAIGTLTNRTPKIDEVSGIAYQLIHRTASAARSGLPANVVYLTFEPSPDASTASGEYYRQQMNDLWMLSGCTDHVRFHHAQVGIEPTGLGSELLGLPKGEETAELIIAALTDTHPLFSFTNVAVTTVE